MWSHAKSICLEAALGKSLLYRKLVHDRNYTLISSPEPNANLRAFWSKFVRLPFFIVVGIPPPFFPHILIFFKNQYFIVTKLVLKHSWGKGFKVCPNKWSCPLLRWNVIEGAKIEKRLRCLKFSSPDLLGHFQANLTKHLKEDTFNKKKFAK